ncbi:MAG: isoprenylcysteine carboxylmethyltransferase family protein [Candidatus Bathyarchaeota archaeon]|nr:MAG: isoprenylcysteine carboxylmethyltransferase family protein [Candidatus Bathyarchaeota archaeon]
MSEDRTFLILFALLYAVFTAIRVYYRSRPTVRERPEQEQTEEEERVGGAAGVAVAVSVLGYWASIALYVASPSWMRWSELALPAWIRWAGVLAGIVCLPFLVWIHSTMGRFYLDRLELREDHELITSGPFSRIRNPMYLVLCVFAFSMGLVTSYALNLLFSIATAASLNWIVDHEEEMLLERFGDEYRAYMERTGRFLPHLGRQADNQ